MIQVHHLEQSRSERILWLVEELGIDYELVRYGRDPQTRLAPAALRALHPLGKSPVITDGTLMLAESGAIVDYLIERYDEAGRLAPARGSPDRARYTYWLHFAEGSLAPPFVFNMLLATAGEAAVVAKTYVANQFRAHLDYVEGELARSAWLAGDHFSGADIMMTRHLSRVSALETSAARPRIAAYLDKAHARPAYLRAMARADG